MDKPANRKFFPSIDSLYPRSRETNLLEIGGELREDAWNCVKEWEFTEKINGANFSFLITHEGITPRGRTANAQFKMSQVEAALACIPSHEDFVEYFGLVEESPAVTIFGELYGQGIQKGSGHTGEVCFRAFDLQIGRFFHSGKQLRSAAYNLNIPTVPYLGTFNLDEPLTHSALADIIPESIAAVEDTGTFGVIPEGIVARPTEVLLDTYGNRIWWKITNRDLSKLV